MIFPADPLTSPHAKIARAARLEQSFINGALVGSNTDCGPANTYQLAGAKTFTQWLTGSNTLEVRWTGDNITDGALVSIDNVTFTPRDPNPNVVPEPSTYLLMATGLGLLALVGRRKQGRS